MRAVVGGFPDGMDLSEGNTRAAVLSRVLSRIPPALLDLRARTLKPPRGFRFPGRPQALHERIHESCGGLVCFGWLYGPLVPLRFTSVQGAIQMPLPARDGSEQSMLAGWRPLWGPIRLLTRFGDPHGDAKSRPTAG